MNNTTTSRNTSTLTETVKVLHEVSPMMTVKDILENLSINHKHLQVDYRKVYNTMKRVSGNSSKTSKPSNIKKVSIVLDLTQTPKGPAIPGVVVNSGKK